MEVLKNTLAKIIPNERWRSFVFWFALIIIIDQLGKSLAFKYLEQPYLILFKQNAVFGLSLFENYNFAFSFPIPEVTMYFLYAVILIILSIYLILNFYKLNNKEFLGFVLIFSGSISNVGERIIFGYVKDFIYIWNGAIINFADISILCGVVYLLWLQYKNFRIS